MRASRRNGRNEIVRLEDDRKVWHRNGRDVAAVVEGYFGSIFSSRNPSGADLDCVIQPVVPALTSEINAKLVEVFTVAEVKRALFEMGSNKAPGPDGFHAAFFQRNWDIVGRIFRMCVFGF